MKYKIRKFVRFVYYHTRQFFFLISGNPCAKGFIFMLHRVSEWDNNGILWNENMKVSPSKLDEIITWMEKEYDIIRLEDVPDRLEKKYKRKFVVFTFDDGYKDNLTNALPIFKKHNVPFTIFVTSDFMDRKAVLWWYQLEELLTNHSFLTLSNGKTYPANTKEEKSCSFLEIREELLKIEQKDIVNGLDELFSYYDVDWYSKCEDLCLSWDELISLSQEPLVTIGAHTQHHYNLTQLKSDDEVNAEILNGYKRITSKTGIQMSVFAYPFGLARDREIQVASNLKSLLILSVMASGGAVTNETKDLFCLPRIMLEETFDKISLMRLCNCYV